MNLTNCPHCSSLIPPEFAVMPVCSICGGDLSAAPASPVWSSIDIKTDNTRTCPACYQSIKSILAFECPNCGAELSPAGKIVDDIEKEKEDFEAAVQATRAGPEPTKISGEIDYEIAATQAEMEVASIEEELKMPESVVINVGENRIISELPTIPFPENIILKNPIMNPYTSEEEKFDNVLKSSTTSREIKPYPERDRDEDFISLKEKAQQKKKEGFFAKILRMFGFKKD